MRVDPKYNSKLLGQWNYEAVGFVVYRIRW